MKFKKKLNKKTSLHFHFFFSFFFFLFAFGIFLSSFLGSKQECYCSG